MVEQEQEHIFERAGLGKPPFAVVGVWHMPSQALAAANPAAYNASLSGQPRTTNGMGVGSCHYCSTAIQAHFVLRGADGQTFMVGSDCVRKTGDAGLVKKVNRILRQQRADRQREQKRLARSAAQTEIGRLIAERSADLSIVPHPYPGFAQEGKTLLDYAKFGLIASSPEVILQRVQDALQRHFGAVSRDFAIAWRQANEAEGNEAE